jgi:hypothetical protein
LWSEFLIYDILPKLLTNRIADVFESRRATLQLQIK